jgi:hypothetical protein
MSSDREQALSAVRVGDVVLGMGAGGQEKLLLVHETDQTGIRARHVTTQMEFKFDRDGRTGTLADGGHCTIISVAQLPASEYQIALGLDRKMRTGKEHPDFVLSKAEIALILSKGAFYKAHPLPEE